MESEGTEWSMVRIESKNNESTGRLLHYWILLVNRPSYNMYVTYGDPCPDYSMLVNSLDTINVFRRLYSRVIKKDSPSVPKQNTKFL